jgi:hypothetical protein
LCCATPKPLAWQKMPAVFRALNKKLSFLKLNLPKPLAHPVAAVADFKRI